jgi:hypothetical protein
MGVQFGEPGIADWLAIYCLPDAMAGRPAARGQAAARQGLPTISGCGVSVKLKDGAAVYTMPDFEAFRTFQRERFDRSNSPVKGQLELLSR